MTEMGQNRVHGRWLVWALLVVAAGLAWAPGCGSRDRPGDCTPHEYFNERTKRCTSCPAVEVPSCKPGCGYEIVEDERGCPSAECRPACDLCAVGERFSEESSQCEACPGVPDCQVFGCEGELQVTGSFEGACPPVAAYACGECETPEDGCVANEDDQCVDP